MGSLVRVQEQGNGVVLGITKWDGTAASTYVLCPHVYMCPYLPRIDQYPRSEGKIEVLESVRAWLEISGTLRVMRMKAQSS